MGERMEQKFKKANHVRRNLFGPVDHDNLQQEFQRILYASMEKAKRRWNFDFAQEMPAEGLLQWEELKDREVPTFYHACVVGDARKPLQPMNRAVAKEARVQRTGKVKSQSAKKKKSLAGKKRKDTFLTDYYTAKKKQFRVDLQTPVKNPQMSRKKRNFSLAEESKVPANTWDPCTERHNRESQTGTF